MLSGSLASLDTMLRIGFLALLEMTQEAGHKPRPCDCSGEIPPSWKDSEVPALRKERYGGKCAIRFFAMTS
jgi:hypothetical protein